MRREIEVLSHIFEVFDMAMYEGSIDSPFAYEPCEWLAFLDEAPEGPLYLLGLVAKALSILTPQQ